MLIQGVVLTIPQFLLERSSASHVVRTDPVTISVAPVSEANADSQTTKAYAMVVLHASVIVRTTTRTTQITQMDHLCADGTTGNHGSQTLQECVNHKFVADHFHMNETTRDLMVKLLILMLMILNHQDNCKLFSNLRSTPKCIKSEFAFNTIWFIRSFIPL